MKKILYLCALCVLTFLVACTGEQKVNVNVTDILFENNTFEATLNIVEGNEDIILELSTESIYSIYEQYKDKIGLAKVNMYFKIIYNDEEKGIIAYQANQSVEKPGLTLLSEDIK